MNSIRLLKILKSFRRTVSKSEAKTDRLLDIVVARFQNVLEKRPVYENNRYGPTRDCKEFKLVLKAR